MFGDKYKIDNEKIKPSPEAIKSLCEKMKYNIESKNEVKMKSKKKFKYVLVAASFMFVFISATGYFISNGHNKNGNLANFKLSEKDKKSEFIVGLDEDTNSNNNDEVDKNDINKTENKTGIYIPKTEIVKPTEGLDGCIGYYVIYNGKVYMKREDRILEKHAKLLLGKKLGDTIKYSDGIKDAEKDGGEKLDLGKVKDFTGTIGSVGIYEIKGYDKDFRIMSYREDEHGIVADLYECLDDIKINNGKDIFGKMNVLNNVIAAKNSIYESGRYETQDNIIVVDETLNKFIEAMYKSVPYDLHYIHFEDKFRDEVYYNEIEYKDKVQYKKRFLYLENKDGTLIQIEIYCNGYIYYNGLNTCVFKIEDKAFNDLWDILINSGV